MSVILLVYVNVRRTYPSDDVDGQSRAFFDDRASRAETAPGRNSASRSGSLRLSSAVRERAGPTAGGAALRRRAGDSRAARARAPRWAGSPPAPAPPRGSP